jgi:hypothetical protein
LVSFALKHYGWDTFQPNQEWGSKETPRRGEILVD